MIPPELVWQMLDVTAKALDVVFNYAWPLFWLVVLPLAMLYEILKANRRYEQEKRSHYTDNMPGDKVKE